jgi:hypothetical protein
VRIALLRALVSCAPQSRRLWAHRFLTGLSADEMQFIAEFLGASILDPCSLVVAQRRPTRAELAERIEEFHWNRVEQPRSASQAPSPDEEHKMILLLEYLSRATIQQFPAPLRSARV